MARPADAQRSVALWAHETADVLMREADSDDSGSDGGSPAERRGGLVRDAVTTWADTTANRGALRRGGGLEKWDATVSGILSDGGSEDEGRHSPILSSVSSVSDGAASLASDRSAASRQRRMERMGRRVELRENKAWGSVLAGLMGEDGDSDAQGAGPRRRETSRPRPPAQDARARPSGGSSSSSTDW